MSAPPSWLSSIVLEDVHRIRQTCKEEIKALSGSTVLITGCTGFLAREFTEVLLDSISDELDIGLVLTSRNPDKVRRVFGDRIGSEVKIIPVYHLDSYVGKVDHIIHAASPCDPVINSSAPLRTIMDITDMTMNVVELGLKNDVDTIMMISSGAVYGVQPPEMDRITEDYIGGPDLRKPSSTYGEAKRYSEQLLVASGLPFVILRGFTFIGPNQDLGSSFAVPNFLHMAMNEGRITINGDGRPIRSFCYESDFAIMMFKSLFQAKYSTLNAGNDNPQLSILELASIISSELGGIPIEGPVEPGGDTFPPRYVPDIGMITRIHVPTIDVRTAISRVVRHINEAEYSGDKARGGQKRLNLL